MDLHLSQHIVHAGWLIKSPPEKRIWKTKWRRRWFVLKLAGQIPGQYVLEYYTDATCKKLKGTIDLDQCEQVDAGLQLEIRKQNYDNMFDLRTSKRTYYLVAGNEDEMNKWVEYICAVCGLKIESVPFQDIALPSIEISNEERYSPQPSQSEQHQQQQQLQPSASESSSSSLPALNYIPIYECYTGQPQNHSTPPPPRPPKPPTLQLHKSQVSLAFWAQDQQTPNEYNQVKSQQPMLPVKKSSSKLLSSVIMNNNDSKRSSTFYLNPPKPNQPHNFYDTWHSRSRRPDLDNAHFLAPPQVNRELKPKTRLHSSDHQEQNIKKNGFHLNGKNQLFQQQTNRFSNTLGRHTLPRPLITSYTLNTRKQKMNAKDPDGYCHLALCEQPKSIIDECERQYLDLYLEIESTQSASPRTPNDTNNLTNGNNMGGQTNEGSQTTQQSSPSWNVLANNNNNSNYNQFQNHNNNHVQQPDLLTNHINNNNMNGGLGGGITNINNNSILPSDISDHSSTVYKKVDFLKTKALNEMNVKMYRNAN